MSKNKRHKSNKYILRSRRRNLVEDFKAEVERKLEEYKSEYSDLYDRELERWYENFWGDDDDDDIYFENGVWKSSSRKVSKKHHNPNKKKVSKRKVVSRIPASMDPNEQDLAEAYYDESVERKIYYYEDVNRVKCREFSTLTQFDLFITREGIDISDEDIYDLVYLDEVHCCINPIEYSKNGNKKMLVCSSYSDLRWSVSDLSLGTSLASEYYLEEEYEEL